MLLKSLALWFIIVTFVCFYTARLGTEWGYSVESPPRGLGWCEGEVPWRGRATKTYLLTPSFVGVGLEGMSISEVTVYHTDAITSQLFIVVGRYP